MSIKNFKYKYIAFSLVIIILLAAFLSSCLQTPASTPTILPTAADPTPMVTPALTPNTSKGPLASSANVPSLVLPDFATIIAKVRPSVVAIDTKTPSFDVFNGSTIQDGAGSGWIIDSKGLIVTNNHVVEGADSITVTLENGNTYSAQSVWTDPPTDLAVLIINAPDLPALQIGDSSQLKVGDWVVAIGNSLGMGISATKGIVSAVGVSLSATEGVTLNGLIQTDAAINPGNSGGPLVNLSGQVIGINSAKIAQVGVEGMGYSISINEARPIIDELIKNGHVARAYLGASLYTVDQFARLRFRLSVDTGALVTQIAGNGPAAKAGIKAGDVIIDIDGQAVTSANQLTQILQSDKIGQQVKITFYRGTSQKIVTVTLEDSPAQ